MKDSEFAPIFLGPLFKKKIDIKKINKNIYKEVLDLTNRFLISSQVLNNIICDHKDVNPLTVGLKKQSQISNLKKLINKKELFRIAKLFNENGIKYVFLKGAAINLLSADYLRYSRDIDILVEKGSLSKVYQLLKEIGFKYRNPLVSDNTKYISNSYHLPIFLNDDGALVEIHHRITDRSIYKDCPLSKSMLTKCTIIKHKGINIKIPNLNNLISHIVYHAVLHHNFDMGPIFLYDIKHLRGLLDNEKDLVNLLESINLDKEYREISNYIDSNNMKNPFDIYINANTKINENRNSKKLGFLIFTKKGRSILFKKFLRNEDSYQTSKYSLKFYIILIIEFKDYCIKFIRN
jgi:hypothetical protein